jgi:putative ABC transport system permease protein
MKFEEPLMKANWLLRFTRKVLSSLTDEETLSSIMDDLSYRYHSLKEEKGTLAALVRHSALFFMLLVPFLFQNILGGFAMLKNYMTTALRHFRKQKAISIINITGLTIGITCTILITLFIKDELSYDRFHENHNSIYRPLIRFHYPDGSVEWQGSTVHVPHGPALKEYFPEVKRYVRVFPRELVVKLGDLIENQEVILADAEFFEMFSFPLIQGQKASVLSDISSIVISESYAKKYFGEKDPIGKTFTLISGNFRNDFIVTGVAKDPPPDSTIAFNLLLNIESISLFGRADTLTSWSSLWTSCKTYIELKDKESAATIKQRYPEFARKYYAARFERERNTEFKNASENIDPFSFGLQRMKDTHLDPTASGSRNLTPFYILGGITLIILFIAGINFVTISIGNASSRFIEVGIRKVVGAQRWQLIRQYWNESMILTGFALILGVGTAHLLLPAFNRLTLKSLQLSAVFTPMTLGFLTFMSIILGICVGSYPALFLSRFHPVDIFKGRMKLSGKNYFTRSLVILQFALSIFLIISTMMLGRQIKFMVNQDLGYNKENTIIVKNINASENKYDRLKNRLSDSPGIKGISGAVSSLDGNFYMDSIKYQNESYSVFYNRIDENYFKILEIDVLQGRNFSPELPTDRQAVIVNETLVKKLEIADPIGEMIELQGNFFPIIGVVNDYHMQAKRIEIHPAIHFFDPTHNFHFMMIRFSSSEISRILTQTRSAWKELQPDQPLTYSFLDEDVEAQYVNEKRWNRIVGYSSVMAVLIACLGVFGLTSVSVNRRTKEIGIRKVCGASVFSIIKLLSLESAGWVLIANLIAWPTAVYAMHKWLQNFAYKIRLSPIIFLIAALSMLMVVLLTTCAQTWKTARSNPVDSLRYE